VLSTSLLRTIKREQTPVGAPWSNCDDRTSRRPPFYFPFSRFLGPVVHSTDKFPFQFTGTSSPADDARKSSSIAPFLLLSRNGYLNRSIFRRRNPCSLRERLREQFRSQSIVSDNREVFFHL